ncbi:MAG: AAA family ATPase [Chitinophagales bacterium]
MAVLTIHHQKGGVGKSTLTLYLYNYYSRAGLNCAIIDSDPQGSINSLVDVLKGDLKGVKVIRRQDFTSWKKLKLLNYDLILVDTPPYTSPDLSDIFDISNLILVPTKAGVFDLLALKPTIRLIRQAMKKRKHLKAAVVLNMVVPNNEFIKQMRRALEKKGLPVLHTEIGNRVSYSRALLADGGIFAEKNEKATAEMRKLAVEIIDFLNK